MQRNVFQRVSRIVSGGSHATSRADGFTLIETIAALVLTGLLMTMLSSITGSWLHHWDSGARRAQDVEILVLGANRIAHEIASAIALPATPLHNTPLFSGMERQLVLIREAGAPGESGLEGVRLQAPDKGGLFRSHGRVEELTSLAAFQADDEVMLLPSEYRVTFAYSGTDASWQPRWSGELLPSLIRVTLTRQPEAPDAKWTFTVPLRAMWPAICAEATSFAACQSVASGHQAGIAAPITAAPKKSGSPNSDGEEQR
jgi:general secretion pathway protein J